jgi:hypothetical protein
MKLAVREMRPALSQSIDRIRTARRPARRLRRRLSDIRASAIHGVASLLPPLIEAADGAEIRFTAPVQRNNTVTGNITCVTV